MNAARRKNIETAKQLLQQAYDLLTTARDEEQEYFDNMPENFQDGDKGTAASDNIEALCEAVDAIGSTSDALDLFE